ncbi:MAG: GNAT family N-acetyltransferase [Ignavibacteria bacterium]|nr:GNAT family N-acetyltransferase [Ignavibacteria bacterium]
MNKNDIEFKIAAAGDAEKITTLVNSVYRGENSKKGWTTEADFLGGIRITEEKVRDIIGQAGDHIILAVIESNIIGCVQLENPPGMEYSYFGMLSVDVDYQSKGIGKILINECERYTKEVLGLSEIRMKVINRRKELIEYYERRGYISTGELEVFGSKEGTFGDPTEELVFETFSKKL